MIYGIGTDLVELERFQKVLHRRGPAFERRVFTPAEMTHCRQSAKPVQSLAARFAAKEAVMKALGVGWGPVGWTDIEVATDPRGRPDVQLRGKARDLAARLGITAWHLSLTHTSCHAMAVAIAEGVVPKG